MILFQLILLLEEAEASTISSQFIINQLWLYQIIFIFLYLENTMHISACQNSESMYDTQTLYEQFKAYLKAPTLKKPKYSIENEYKKLYSELKIRNRQKNQILQRRHHSDSNIRKNGCKFQRVQNYESLNQWKDEEILSESILKKDDNSQILDQILLQEMYEKQLDQEISNLKRSVMDTRKKLTQIKLEIKKAETKENKFLQVKHLVDTIEQHTKQVSYVNMKNFKDMANQQEEILKSFKKMKGNIRKELQETEIKYHSQKKEYEMKFKRLKDWKYPLEEEKKEYKVFKIPRGYRRFLQQLEKVLAMLQKNEPEYEKIKQSECTRNIFKRIDLNVLSPERADWFKIIQNFQQKFQMKLESTQKLIIKLYRMLKSENEKRQKKIFEYNHFREDCEQQYLNLVEKEKEFYNIHEQNEFVIEEREKEMLKKKKNINTNSKIFVQFGELFNSLLAKFRYVFKLFIVMNVDKKNYNEQIIRLDSVLQGKDFNYSKMNRGGRFQILHEDTNPIETQQILETFFPNLEFQHMKELVDLFFNDIRVALYCKRCTLMDEIDDCSDKKTWDSIIKVFLNLRDECQNTFLQKIRDLSAILRECLKSAYRGKTRQSKRNIEVPFRMFSNTKLLQDFEMEEDERVITETSAKIKWNLDYINKEKPIQKSEEWGDEAKRNPNQMIRKLQNMKLENEKKFRILDLGLKATHFQLEEKFQDSQDKNYSQILSNLKKNNYMD